MLENYEEVPDRILRFYKDHPEGSLRCERMEFMELPMSVRETNPQTGELVESVEVRLHVIYHALAYRFPGDCHPGQGKASEPIPGLTNYTRGSEIMNAETSAWGRALAALGYVGKKVASANEIRAREEGGGKTPPASRDRKPSPAQKKEIKRLIDTKKVSIPELEAIFTRVGVVGVVVEEGWMDHLTPGREGTASKLIGYLKENPIPTGESDVPYDSKDFEVPKLEGGDTAELPFDEVPKEST